MSLLSEIITQVKGAAHDAVDANSDATRTARQLIRDLDEQIAQAENSLVDVQTNFRLAQSKLVAAQADVTKYTEGAIHAVEKCNDVLALQALQAKNAAVVSQTTYQAQVSAQEPGCLALQSRIDELKAKRADLGLRADNIEARSSMAQAETRAAEIITGIDANGALKSFDELESKVQKQEARAQVLTQHADAATPAKLDAQLAALDVRHVSPADELAALKAKLNQA